jgi:hypothetical protein
MGMHNTDERPAGHPPNNFPGGNACACLPVLVPSEVGCWQFLVPKHVAAATLGIYTVQPPNACNSTPTYANTRAKPHPPTLHQSVAAKDQQFAILGAQSFTRASLKPREYTSSYLACRICHWVPIWQPLQGILNSLVALSGQPSPGSSHLHQSPALNLRTSHTDSRRIGFRVFAIV